MQCIYLHFVYVFIALLIVSKLSVVTGSSMEIIDRHQDTNPVPGDERCQGLSAFLINCHGEETIPGNHGRRYNRLTLLFA